MSKLTFKLIDNKGFMTTGNKRCVYLTNDNWDDWDKYETKYYMRVVDDKGKMKDIGSLKIGKKGLKPASSSSKEKGFRRVELDNIFSSLDNEFFSLGQSENYYEALNELDEELKNEILTAIKDCAFNLAILNENIREEVMRESLLRDFSIENIKNRFYRLSHGYADLTRFDFKFEFPHSNDTSPVLEFVVEPISLPPSNVHVLIGRNGVGKTRCIQNLVRSIIEDNNNIVNYGRIIRKNESKWNFSGIISVSFSAFDDFDLPKIKIKGMKAYQIGLRYFKDNSNTEVSIKSPLMLKKDLLDSFSVCRLGPRRTRWCDAIKALESDPLFEESNFCELLGYNDDDWEIHAREKFSNLSSGHAIVLLTITKLVELVDEMTLVILDEPESHLHPPLLSAFTRALSDLLTKRNGVCLVATHSPVLLQEVPKNCVWKISRSGSTSSAQRPRIETFGENVGILTSEIFGLEVTRSGFHKVLEDALEVGSSYNTVLTKFDEALGSEARMILRGLLSNRDKEDSNE
ncbi:ATP-binding protein [Klebsiella aerogenes]|uniref:ATP-binding protein n=1 Tax=Klebsiella aerogenes TaxID=548 RepID=UPI0021CF6DC8|nr:ATP-binding protein [Klebsiella aerogenes]MCU6423485.1 ATP-binding protein [Klebsiella aerogenes]